MKCPGARGCAGQGLSLGGFCGLFGRSDKTSGRSCIFGGLEAYSLVAQALRFDFVGLSLIGQALLLRGNALLLGVQ